MSEWFASFLAGFCIPYAGVLWLGGPDWAAFGIGFIGFQIARTQDYISR